MASSGSGNRSGGNRTGSGNKGASGNRKPSSARSGGGESATRGQTAADRARERVQQQGGGPGTRSSGNRGRPPARGGGRRTPQRGGSSTTRTAGIFGGTLVVLVAVIIIVFSLLSGSGVTGHDPYIAPFPAKAAIVSAVTNVPNSELAAAGSGSGVISPVGKKGTTSTVVLVNSPETRGGKIVITYFGSEYCPYCAATRWPLTIALSKFGTFSGLEQTASSPLDAYASTHTLTYAKATYSSRYIVFSATEQLSNHCVQSSVVANPSPPPAYVCQNGNYYVVKNPSKAVSALVTKYDSAAYVGGNASGIPFIDFGGRYLESGALFIPSVLQNASWTQIVNSFKVPKQGIGQAVLASANRYIAMICEATHNKPPICSQAFVKSAEKAL